MNIQRLQHFWFSIPFISFSGISLLQALGTQANVPRAAARWAPWPGCPASSRAEPHCQVQRWFTARAREFPSAASTAAGLALARLCWKKRNSTYTKPRPSTGGATERGHRKRRRRQWRGGNGVPKLRKTRPCRCYKLRGRGERGRVGAHAHHEASESVGEVGEALTRRQPAFRPSRYRGGDDAVI